MDLLMKDSTWRAENMVRENTFGLIKAPSMENGLITKLAAM
jgi:hypothetical protein